MNSKLRNLYANLVVGLEEEGPTSSDLVLGNTYSSPFWQAVLTICRESGSFDLLEHLRDKNIRLTEIGDVKIESWRVIYESKDKLVICDKDMFDGFHTAPNSIRLYKTKIRLIDRNSKDLFLRYSKSNKYHRPTSPTLTLDHEIKKFDVVNTQPPWYIYRNPLKLLISLDESTQICSLRCHSTQEITHVPKYLLKKINYESADVKCGQISWSDMGASVNELFGIAAKAGRANKKIIIVKLTYTINQKFGVQNELGEQHEFRKGRYTFYRDIYGLTFKTAPNNLPVEKYNELYLDCETFVSLVELHKDAEAEAFLQAKKNSLMAKYLGLHKSKGEYFIFEVLRNGNNMNFVEGLLFSSSGNKINADYSKIKCKDGLTVTAYLAMSDFELCVKFMRKYGVGPNVKIDDEGNTLLHYAAKWNDKFMSELLFRIEESISGKENQDRDEIY
eukprot:UN06519